MPHAVRRLVPALLLAATAARPALAQQTPVTLTPGDRVRVSAPPHTPHRVQGELVLYQGDSIAVREEGTGTVYLAPVTSVRSLAKNVGLDRGRSVRRGARLGLFLGASVGAVAGPLLGTDEDTDQFYETIALSTGGGAVLGVALGAAYGALFARERWQGLRMPIRPVMGTTSGGATTVSFSIPVS
jgi:hypothetical protein